MHDVNKWLKSTRDYQIGCKIYAAYGKYERVKQLLSKGETELTKEKLLQVMQQLSEQLGEKKEAVLPESVRPKTAQPEKLKIEAPAQYLIDLDNKWKPIYAEMSVMHSRLLMAQSDEARYSLAQHIVHLEDTLIDIWAKRDFYIANGKPMPTQKRKVVRKDITNFELRQLLNARSSLSQYKNIHLPKALAEQTAKPSKKAEKRVERMYASIKKYESIIKKFEL